MRKYSVHLFMTVIMLVAANNSVAGVNVFLGPEDTITYTGTILDTNFAGSNFPNLRLFRDSIRNHAELTIAANPNDGAEVLAGAMTVAFDLDPLPRQGAYHTTDEGVTWDGTPNFQSPPIGRHTSNGSVAYDDDGNAYYTYLDIFSASTTRVWGTSSANGGDDWPGSGDMLWEITSTISDKPHMAIDNFSPREGNIYVAWTNLNINYSGLTHANVALFRSNDIDWPRATDTLERTVSISEGVTGEMGLCQGVNLAVGKNGVLYAAWSIYDSAFTVYNYSLDEDAIGFNRSLDGGETWPTAQRIVEDIEGIRVALPGDSTPLEPKFLRVQSFPSMAIDTAVGDSGLIYLVWADRRHGDGPGSYKDADVLLIKSTDGGESWSEPLRINDDTEGNGCDQWWPWVTVDPEGGVNVIFYDTRNDENNRMTETWVARSHDHGETFHNFRVSEVAFDPAPVIKIPGGGWLGDYIGIASSDEYVFPAWSDNRTTFGGESRGTYQAQVARLPIDKMYAGDQPNGTEWDSLAILIGHVVIGEGDTLRITAGTEVKACSNPWNPVGIDVFGTLIIDDSTRPLFSSDNGKSGSWSGIKVWSGGSIDWGKGCVIADADIGISLQSGAASSEIRNVRVENAETYGFEIEIDVSMVHDTVLSVPGGTGIFTLECDVDVDSSYVENCEYGYYAIGSSATLADVWIEGPGVVGLYLLTSSEDPGDDTLDLTRSAIDGHYSQSHMFAGASANCRINESQFVTDTLNSIQSPIGIEAGDGSWVNLRSSAIIDFGEIGFYSDNSASDLGTSASHGNNSITTDECLGSTCDEMRVVHVCPLLFGGGGPDPEPACELKAEYNWWGYDPPYAAWFEGTDYDPWLEEDPLGKRSVRFVEVEHDQPASVPVSFTLEQNYPNPFNPSTVISFSLKTDGRVQADVFNILGQRVKRLLDGELSAGSHRVVWDGTSDNGSPVASGMYLYRVVTEGESVSRKMVLLR